MPFRSYRLKCYGLFRSCLSVALFSLLFILLAALLTDSLQDARAGERLLKIEHDTVLEPLLREFETAGSNLQAYRLSARYRLDLTLFDLIDQSSEITQKFPRAREALRHSLGPDPLHPDFYAWLGELKKQANLHPRLAELLDQKLELQLYSENGVALLPQYKFIDLKKIGDNGRLERIRKYNLVANDPEGAGLRLAFARTERPEYFTRPLTVAKLSRLQFKELKKLRRSYYAQLVSLYKKRDPEVTFSYNRHGLEALSRRDASRMKSPLRAIKTFNTLQTLPRKYDILEHLCREIPEIPIEHGIAVLTPTFLEDHFEEIERVLKEYTLTQFVDSLDDRYLLSVRNFLRQERKQIDQDLVTYNQTHGTTLEISLPESSKKPSRLEAITHHATLLLLYPDMPWHTEKHGILISRKGREIFIHKNEMAALGHLLSRLARELVQTETYLSLLAGSTTLVLAPGNIPLAMSTKNLVKRAIQTARYDHELEKFLKAAPGDVVNALLWGSGFAPGRFYKIIALGTGQGLVQSLVTGQDLSKGATVGAALSLVQFYALPGNIGRPLAHGVDHASLVRNRIFELVEKTVRGGTHGAAVAALEGESALRGTLKGSAYGLLSTPALIWLLGTRYDAFKDFDPAKVDEAIRLENKYQNTVGRGGYYKIDRQLILDSNFRRGGVFPNLAGASVTLPGSVTMGSAGYRRLLTLTHEASHLMQQHQSGVFGFYLFRYLPAVLKGGANPDENYLDQVIQRI